MDVGQLAVRHVNKARNVAAQIQQSVHFHRRLGCAEVGPRKDRQAQVDGGRIQGVDRIGQVQTKILRRVQLPRLGDQPLGQIRVDAPIARFVGVGQRRAPNRFAQAHVIQLRRLNRQARLDIPQTLPVGQLGKRHGPVLLAAVQRTHPIVATIPRNDPAESLPRQKLHQLSEKRLAGVHRSPLGKFPKNAPSSNRGHPVLLRDRRNPWLSAPRPLS